MKKVLLVFVVSTGLFLLLASAAFAQNYKYGAAVSASPTATASATASPSATATATATASATASPSATASAVNSGKSKDFAGLVDIGRGTRDVHGVPGQRLSHGRVRLGGRRPHRNLEQDARPIQAGGVARDRPNQQGMRLRSSRDFSRDW